MINEVLEGSASTYQSKGSHESRSQLDGRLEEKLRNLRLIAFGVGLMVLFLIMRMTLVIMRNYYADVYMGYAALYCAATLIPEVICNLIMLALVVFTFYQSQHVSLKTLSANSAYQSGTELRWEFSSLDCIFLFLFSHC